MFANSAIFVSGAMKVTVNRYTKNVFHFHFCLLFHLESNPK